ncbi:hypothetical protein VTO42DRAFT_9001 [Malbranchea cinnamomea]
MSRDAPSSKGPFVDKASASEVQPLASVTSFESTLVLSKDVSLTLDGESLIVSAARSKHKSSRNCCCRFPFHTSGQRSRRVIPTFNVLWADISQGYITIKYAHPKSKVDVTVRSVYYPVSEEQTPKAETWAQRLLDVAYGEAQRQKRIKILINPAGGRGRAKTLYYKHAEPIFAAARCEIDVEITTHQGHATEIAEKLDIDAFDVIVPCSGDGLVYEVFNGLGKRPNAAEALGKIAVTHLPCGSGNAMSWNLNGTGSVSMAALCIVKGLRMPLDLVSITQGGRRHLSFLSQSYGIVADSDLGTDDLRWMGAFRFTYGFLVRLFGKTVYPCDIAIKVEMDDKQRIKDHYKAEIQKRLSSHSREEVGPSGGLPPLKYGTVTDPLPEGWELIPHDKLGNFYAGKMAFMAQDANFFPAALPNDGLLDLVIIRGDISRSTAFQMMLTVEDGTLFDMPQVTVKKISGYRLIPKRREGFISIDGEKIPFEPFQAEVHRGLGTVLSRSGYRYEAKGVA